MAAANKVFRLVAILATLLLVLAAISGNGQITTPCTSSMISSFTPCFNFITGSSSNVSSPTTSCCDSFRSLTSTSMDCACLLITANVPFQLPINRTLALTLPRACNIGGVPIQCKASGAPIPAPAPGLFGPTLPPTTAASPFSPRASKAVALAPAPESDTTLQPTPASPPVEPEAPTTTPATPAGIRPVLNPSASCPSYASPASLLLTFVGIMVFKSY